MTPSSTPSTATPTVSTDIITTCAGVGNANYSGDNGPATSAALYYPNDVFSDTAGMTAHLFVVVVVTFTFAIPSLGNLYIADSWNHRIRKVTASTGIITTTAGTGTKGYSGDNGPATTAALNFPQGLALDLSGSPFGIIIIVINKIFISLIYMQAISISLMNGVIVSGR